MILRTFLIPVLIFVATLAIGTGIVRLASPAQSKLASRTVEKYSLLEKCVPLDVDLRYQKLPLTDSHMQLSEVNEKDPLSRDERPVPESARSYEARAFVLIHRERCDAQ